MALRPKELYPSQTTSGDAGYPYGKAKNVGTPGDGSGTPYEERVVNELWGWQQALLVAAGITPNDLAEKVGSSQYLAAITKLIANGLATLPGLAFLWTNVHVFTANVSHNAITNLNSVNIQQSQEVLYTAPKTRRIMVPLHSFVPSQGLASSWKLVGGTAWQITTGSGQEIAATLRLPAGAVLIEARAYCVSGGGSDLGLQVEKLRYDTTSGGGLSSPTPTPIGAAPVQAPGASGTLSTGIAAEPFTDRDLLCMRINAGTIANLSIVTWAEVVYTEMRATGSQ